MKSKFLEDFKKFAMRGNVVDMAVGIIIGGAFGKIVSSLVADVIMPPIGLLIGGVNFTDLKITLEKAVLSPGGEVVKPAVSINYGNFLQTTLDFLIISFSIFLLIRLLSKLQEKKKPRSAICLKTNRTSSSAGNIRETSIPASRCGRRSASGRQNGRRNNRPYPMTGPEGLYAFCASIPINISQNDPHRNGAVMG